MSTNFSLPGDVGAFVRSQPFDQRSIQYQKSGLGDTLGQFVGSARQNQALFNFSQKSKAPVDTTGADFILGKTTPTPGQDVNASPGASGGQPGASNPQIGALDTGITDKSGFAQVPDQNNQYYQFQGSPDVFDQTGKHITPEEAQATPDFFKNVQQVSTPRPEVQQESDYAKYAGQDVQAPINDQAQQIENQTMGAMTAAEIQDFLKSSPVVSDAQDYHDKLITRNNDTLAAQVKKLADKEGVDEQVLSTKVAIAKRNILLSMERRGLAGSSFQTVGEARTEASGALSLAKLRAGLTNQEQLNEARNLARNQKLDINLAKSIVGAVNSEMKARARLQTQQQTQLTSYLKTKGIVINPSTGVQEKSAAELRAEEASQRAQESSQRAADSAQRAQVNFDQSQAKKAGNQSPYITPKGATLPAFKFSGKQLTTLQTQGLQPNDAQGILQDIQAGHSLEDVRTNMKSAGLDFHLLDNIMRLVDPANNTPPKAKVTTKTPAKTTPASGSGRTP